MRRREQNKSGLIIRGYETGCAKAEENTLKAAKYKLKWKRINALRMQFLMQKKTDQILKTKNKNIKETSINILLGQLIWVSSFSFFLGGGGRGGWFRKYRSTPLLLDYFSENNPAYFVAENILSIFFFYSEMNLWPKITFVKVTISLRQPKRSILRKSSKELWLVSSQVRLTTWWKSLRCHDNRKKRIGAFRRFVADDGYFLVNSSEAD